MGKVKEELLLEATLTQDEVTQDSCHGFTKLPLVMPDQSSDLHNNVKTHMGKGRATDDICLGFCKAYDVVPDYILISLCWICVDLKSRIFSK